MSSCIVHEHDRSLRPKKQAITDMVEGRLGYALLAAGIHNERALHPEWLLAQRVDLTQGLWWTFIPLY
jgi:hypothetical protein